MNDKPMITQKQFFILLFVCRISLAIIYSSSVSGIFSVWDMLMPLIITIPLMLIMFLPSLSYGRISGDGSFFTVKIMPVIYSAYFLFSALYSTAVMYGFMLEAVPDGIEPKVLLALLIAGCIYASLKGIEASARMSGIVLVFIISAVVLTAVFLMQNYRQENLPVQQGISFFSISDCVVFIISRYNCAAAYNVFSGNIRKRSITGGLLFVIMSVVFMVFGLVMLRGSTGNYMDTHSFQIYNAAEGSGNLQRLDPVFILVIVCSCFCGTALMLLASVESMRTVLKTVPHKKLCIINGVILLLMMLFLQRGMTEYICNKYLWFVLNTVFIFVLPLMLLLYKKFHSKAYRFAAAGSAAVFTVVITAFVLSGCSTVQLSQRIIIQGIGIDHTDKYKLTMSVLDTGDAEKPNSSRLIYSEGKSISEAIESLESQRGKKVLFSQCLFIMMDKNSSDIYRETLDYFTERKDIRSNVSIMVTEGTAENTIRTAVDEFGYNMEDINMLTDSKTVDSGAVQCAMSNVQCAMYDNRYKLVFPYAVINDDIRSLMIRGSVSINN